MSIRNCYEILQKKSIFSSLSKSHLEQLIRIGKEITIEPGSYLVHEGDIASNFFIIIEGTLEVVKSDEAHQNAYDIAHLTTGDTIGEVALIDQGTRSASVRAGATPVRLLEISTEALRAMAEQDFSFHPILLQIAKNLSSHLRLANEAIILSFKSKIDEYKLRVSMGSFMMNVIAALCIFDVLASVSPYLMHIVSSSTIITIPLTMLCVFFSVLIIKSSHLPLRALGLTLENWRPSVFESLIFTSIILFLMFLAKVVLIHTSFLEGRSLFAPYSFITVHSGSSFSRDQIWLITLLSYWLLVSPLQELIARGGLQGPLEIFLTGKYRELKAVFFSNLIFAAAHLFLSPKLTVMVFFMGIYLGWLYSRHRTLVGVVLAHALIGTWGFWILGI